MREMVLNHASVTATDLYTAITHLKGVASGIAELINARIVERALRLDQTSEQIICVEEWSLEDVLQEMRRQGDRDEYIYFRSLTKKYPLLTDVNQDIKDRFNLCEATGCGPVRLPAKDGQALLLCVLTGGIAVGFPSEPIWDRDEIIVDFDELLPNDEFESRTENIDNLSRSTHATAIAERFRDYMRDRSSPMDLWDQKGTAFPNLTFGPEVQDNLGNVEMFELTAIIKKLAIIDDCAAAWKNLNSAMPEWRGKITPESNSVKNNRTLYEARRFKSSNGSREIFEWHARCPGAKRIHFRFDAQTKEVEIGYIGKHLPL